MSLRPAAGGAERLVPPEAAAQYGQGVEMREVVVGGRAVRWRVEGRGPPLVCVAGLSGSWRWWLPVLPRIAEQFELHLLDLPRFSVIPRFGPADAAGWLGRWLDEAALVQPTLVGHSLGGLFAVQLVSSRPDAVDRLVLLDPVGVPTGWGTPREAIALALSLRTATPRFLPVLLGDALRWGSVSLLRGLAHAVAVDLTVELGRIAVPTLVVWGGRDALVPVRLAPAWRDAIPGARLVVIERAGHVPMFEAPEELCAALLAFLGEEGANERGDLGRPGVVDGVGAVGDDGEPTRG
ncbi:MAG: alpha/beta fold hydrolase [Gaiellaceae bacterium]